MDVNGEWSIQNFQHRKKEKTQIFKWGGAWYDLRKTWEYKSRQTMLVLSPMLFSKENMQEREVSRSHPKMKCHTNFQSLFPQIWKRVDTNAKIPPLLLKWLCPSEPFLCIKAGRTKWRKFVGLLGICKKTSSYQLEYKQHDIVKTYWYKKHHSI